MIVTGFDFAVYLMNYFKFSSEIKFLIPKEGWCAKIIPFLYKVF
jgi:hypothetical protein